QELPGCDDLLGEVDWHSALTKTSAFLNDGRSVKWFPEYGCALLAIGSSCALGGPLVRRNLSLVGLDNWKLASRWLNPPSAPSTLQYGSDAGSPSIVHAGIVEEANLDPLLRNLNKSLAQASERHGDKRTAAGGKQGHQKTPSMIEALLRDAKAALDGASACHQPRGGFTDVGLHTGGRPRETAWPLTLAIFQAGLKRHGNVNAPGYPRGGPDLLGVLFDVVMVDFYLTLLEQHVVRLSGDAEDLDKGMRMLESAAHQAGVLADDGHALPRVAKRIEKARQSLSSLKSERMASAAADFKISNGTDAFADDHLRLPKVVLSAPLPRPSAGEGGFDEARSRSTKNLSSLPSFAREAHKTLTSESMADITSWVVRDDLSGELPAQVVLAEVEGLLFTTAASRAIESAAQTLRAGDLAELKTLVNTYRSVLAGFLDAHSGDGGSYMVVERHSRETLVCLIAYAVAFAVTRGVLWPEEMEAFGVCLRAGDLQHLVLADRLAVDAALSLADYLAFANRGTEKAIFSLADGGRATFSLALKVASGSADLQRIWESEVASANRRRDAHWTKVEAQQAELFQLRMELQSHEEELAENQAAYERARHSRDTSSDGRSNKTRGCRRHLHCPGGCTCRRCSVCRSAKYACWSVEAKIATVNSKAQQMLLPRAWDTNITDAVKTPNMDLWSAYYNSHQPAVQGHNGGVQLGYCGELGQPETMVDRCTEPSDGVWHPDSLAPGYMLWQGGSFSRQFCFDPLSPKVRPEWVVRGFTEKLLGQDQSLQWAMPQYGIGKTSPERGNISIARQGDAVGFSKREYLAFGGLRAYPLQQLRKLALVLRDRSLPLDHPAIRTLMSQALFQIGELSDSCPATLLWRNDQEDMLSALFDELQVRIEAIEHTPRQHRTMQLLVDMAVYVGHWNGNCQDLVRSKLVAIPRKWAIDIYRQADEAEANQLGDAVVSSLIAKQYLYFMYGVLCYGGSASLSAADTAQLCELQILAHNRRLFAEGWIELEAESSALQVRCLNVLAKRSGDITQEARINPGFLTTAIRLVLKDAPTQLAWNPVASKMACFEAQHQGHLYTVNLLTGVVLFDGEPPSRLPGDITKDNLYRRVFGKARFEVSLASGGMFRTTRTADGRFYEFSRVGVSGELLVEEVDERLGERLELLRPDGSWAKELPVRLRRMHSHWLCRDQNAIVLRSIEFSARHVFFVGRCSRPDGGPVSFYRVPPHFRSHEWNEILVEAEGKGEGLGPSEKLVLADADNIVMKTFAKFEPRAVGQNAVIHTYLQPDGGLTIDLPRFELEFKVDSPPNDPRGREDASGIHCASHRGYQLACAQQLEDTLPELSRYLVLVREDGDTKIIVPRGRVAVREGATPRVWIECSNEASEDAELKVFSYSLHRRWNQPDAGGLSARLQLAAMFAATGTLLPDPRAGKTGSEKTIELVRRCSVNHPLQPGDRDQLLTVLDLSGAIPALALLCGDLLESSTCVDFLHPTAPLGPLPPGVLHGLEDAATAYEGECETSRWNIRRRLTAIEEVRIFGGRIAGARPYMRQRRVFEFGSVDPPRCPVRAESVHAAEVAVWEVKDVMLASTTRASDVSRTGHAYPLEVPLDGDVLTKDMHAELRGSWETHQLSPLQHSPVPPPVLQRLRDDFSDKLRQVSSMRERLEQHLLGALVSFGTDDRYARSYHIERLANLLPTPSVEDLPSILWSDGRARTFNPFLTEEASTGIEAAVVLWLRCCVLEDKLGRLKRWTGKPGAEALVWQEIEVKRTWAPEAYPRWLAFEVDSGLQIRPAQAEVALHMIDHPGDIVQLNMGEGKTRVILPLLVLHWTTHRQDAAVVRLHFLSALIGEAFDFLHHALTGSLLGCALFLLPFNRDVNLTLAGARAMRGCLERCLCEGGAMLVTPEHRQSLHLKGLELLEVAPEISKEIGRLEEMPFRDIFDESDELFHHRKQLVYAVGGLKPLPSQADRVQAVQAMLRVLKHRHRHPELTEMLSNRNVAVEEVRCRPEQFGQLRLLPGRALDDIKRELHRALFDSVMSDPPYEMRWLGDIDEQMRAKLATLVLDDTVSADHVLERSALADESQWAQVLALRGLLAHGTLLHCLQSRPRVNYGVSRTAEAKKRLAVPFRASNTPADRSEFRQPDVAIVYTVLSYYYDGLSRAELQQVLKTLLEDVPESAQADFYSTWLDEVRPAEEDLAQMDDVLKLDLTNEPQMDILYRYFAHNFEVINSWLNFVVLPAETKLCPKYIGTNSWFLAENSAGATSGFSGTNDSHRLLPLQVRKNRDDSLPSLSSTNGKMLDLLMRTERYVTLEVAPDEESIGDAPPEAWKNLLKFCVGEGTDVLVDCGALLGKVSSKEAATFLLSPEGSLSKEFRGVVFFDASQRTAAVGGEWMVLDRVGRCVALSGSPIQASESFCIYDEARCRGADLKLSADAKALLTIGPKNGKDKVMQAAGRLRLLGRSNQAIVFVGTPDVSTQIREVSGVSSSGTITSQHVLGYIMANTVEATRSGLLTWAGQGLEFSATFARPDRAEQDEVTTLDAAYGAGYTRATVDSAVSMSVDQFRTRCKGDVHKPQLCQEIAARASQYGKTVYTSRSSAIEGECEREMELELEEEEEVERHVAKMLPREETDWPYASVLSVESPHQLPSSAKVMTLKKAWGCMTMEAQVSPLDLPAKNVFCTGNFLFGVTGRTAALDDYLRPVDAALVFANGEMVLLSEREADGVLLTLSCASSRSTDSPAPSTPPKLVHLSYTTSELNEPRVRANPLMHDAKLQGSPWGDQRAPPASG
ncbi:unnamed protein product, partial [Ectocarpus sp. 4 AP-2014]